MISPEYTYNAIVTDVIDGDTIDCSVDLGFTVTVNVRFRLYGLDTMETRDKDATKKELGLKAKLLAAETLVGNHIQLRSHKTDKYGRWLAEVFIDGKSFNQRLLDEGLAVSYFGGKKE